VNIWEFFVSTGLSDFIPNDDRPQRIPGVKPPIGAKIRCARSVDFLSVFKGKKLGVKVA
jgi:hypothetical protein